MRPRSWLVLAVVQCGSCSGSRQDAVPPVVSVPIGLIVLSLLGIALWSVTRLPTEEGRAHSRLELLPRRFTRRAVVVGVATLSASPFAALGVFTMQIVGSYRRTHCDFISWPGALVAQFVGEVIAFPIVWFTSATAISLWANRRFGLVAARVLLLGTALGCASRATGAPWLWPVAAAALGLVGGTIWLSDDGPPLGSRRRALHREKKLARGVASPRA